LVWNIFFAQSTHGPHWQAGPESKLSNFGDLPKFKPSIGWMSLEIVGLVVQHACIAAPGRCLDKLGTRLEQRRPTKHPKISKVESVEA
jgi:hypothetical protein